MKKDKFKYLIKEFHEFDFPEVVPRELEIPKTNKVVSLIGPRRAGKTFYFYQLIQGILSKGVPKDLVLYINFEDDRLLPLELENLNELLEAYYELYPDNKNRKKYLFFDEVQNIKGWEVFIRRIVDKEEARIFVTGSSSKLLSKEIATSLRGRTLPFHLFPLSFKEFLKFKNIKLDKHTIYTSSRFKIKKLLEEYINFGGFPEVVKSEKLKKDILSNYFEMFLYRDLVERFAIRNITLLKTLTKYLLTNIASTFSINSYYKTAKQQTKISKDTILDYVSCLEDINLIYLIQVFSYSLKTQQVNPSKVYCIDNGLRNAVSFKFSKDEGKLVENLVFMELKRIGDEIYYWKNKGEVDFVVKNKDQILTAINVTYTDEINKREIESLLGFKKEHKKTKELILITKDVEREEQGIKLMPLWKWLLQKKERSSSQEKGS